MTRFKTKKEVYEWTIEEGGKNILTEINSGKRYEGNKLQVITKNQANNSLTLYQDLEQKLYLPAIII